MAAGLSCRAWMRPDELTAQKHKSCSNSQYPTSSSDKDVRGLRAIWNQFGNLVAVCN